MSYANLFFHDDIELRGSNQARLTHKTLPRTRSKNVHASVGQQAPAGLRMATSAPIVSNGSLSSLPCDRVNLSASNGWFGVLP
jgi:hypothetical protein